MARKGRRCLQLSGHRRLRRPAGTRGGWHIHIVVRVDESRGDAYLVPLSTVLYRDRTCEIDVKDGCALVTERCVVAYFHGKKIRLAALQEVGRFSGPAPNRASTQG